MRSTDVMHSPLYDAAAGHEAAARNAAGFEAAASLEECAKASDFEQPEFKPPRRTKTIQLTSPTASPWTGGQGEDGIHHVGFRLSDLDIDEARLCSGLDCHRRFRVKEGYEMKDLPKFNDLTRYNIQEEQEMNLWKFEVHRLAMAVKSPTPPTLEGHSEW